MTTRSSQEGARRCRWACRWFEKVPSVFSCLVSGDWMLSHFPTVKLASAWEDSSSTSNLSEKDDRHSRETIWQLGLTADSWRINIYNRLELYHIMKYKSEKVIDELTETIQYLQKLFLPTFQEMRFGALWCKSGSRGRCRRLRHLRRHRRLSRNM